jgi:2'-5' RNA ligase
VARLFFALWPDDATRDALAKAAASIDVREGRRVQPANLHLTLAFLGNVPSAAQTALMAAEPAPGAAGFALDVGLAGWWRASRVAWLAPLAEPPALHALHAAVNHAATAVGLAIERRAYRPHVTIARHLRRAPRGREAFEIHWQVTDFVLVESLHADAGGRYEVRRRWPLSSRAGN